MPFVQSWQLRYCSGRHIISEIRDSTAGLHKLFPSLPTPALLGLDVSHTLGNDVVVFCTPPVATRGPLLSTVEIRLDPSGHPVLITRIEFGTSIESVIQHAEFLLSTVSFCCSIDAATDVEKSITYAIKLDAYPCVPFTPQIDDDSDLGKLQKWLGAASRFISWTVPISVQAAAVCGHAQLHSRISLAVGVNFGIDAFSTAQLMLLYSKVSKKSLRVQTYKFLDSVQV